MKLLSRKRRIKGVAPPVLQTERLVLRCFDLNDAVDVFNSAQNPEAARLGGWQRHQTVEDSRAWIQKCLEEGNRWAVVEKKTGRVIGTIALREDAFRKVENAKRFEFALAEGAWAHGFAMEACREVMRYAFCELECPVLSLVHLSQNGSRKRMLKKLGFVYEGVLRRAQLLEDGDYGDWALYSMTDVEYRAQK